MTMDSWDGQENKEDVERSILRALEERREIAVPESFAARVRAALPERPPLRRRMSVAKAVAMLMAGAAVSAMFGLASYASGSPTGFKNLAFAGECVLVAQLAGIMGWLVARRDA